MKKYRFLVLGAHPDDADLCAGGLATLLRRKGHEVIFASVTDGSAGHHQMQREPLAQRRLAETQAAGRVLDVPYHVLPNPDGLLVSTLETREMLMRFIRTCQPDVILTHRLWDYHPDHRSTGQLVMDCSFLVGVPLFCPDVPAMRTAPVILSMYDDFTQPNPIRPDVCVRIDEAFDKKVEACLCHESQFYEWLPWVGHWTDVEQASTPEKKKACLIRRQQEADAAIARRYADLLPEGTRYAEVFEWNEYGSPLTDDIIRAMTEN